MKKKQYELQDFLAELIEKYEDIEDTILTKRIDAAEHDEQLTQEQFFAALEK